MPLDVTRLRQFVTVVQERGVIRGSRKLGVSQPTITRGIASLEREFGCLFLERTSWGVKPTRAGWVFFAHAVSILEAVDTAERDLLKLGRLMNRDSATKGRKRARVKGRAAGGS